MRAPNDSRLTIRQDKCVFGMCQNPAALHAQSCSREHELRIGSNARQSKKRLNKFLRSFIPRDKRDYLPATPRARDYAISEMLAPIGERLSLEGPCNGKFRRASRDKLETMRNCLLLEERTPDRLSLLAQCTIALIEMGIELDPKRDMDLDLMRLLKYGVELVGIFNALGDPANRARSAVLIGNVLRLMKREDLAARVMRNALHIARATPHLYRSMNALAILHIATLHVVRFWKYWNRKESDFDALRIAELAIKIGDGSRRLEAYKSLAGYYIAQQNFKAAFEAIGGLKAVKKTNKLSLYGESATVRPSIEVRIKELASGIHTDLDDARKSVARYVEIYESTLDGYQYRNIGDWRAIPELWLSDYKPRQPTFFSPFLTHLIRYESPEWIANL